MISVIMSTLNTNKEMLKSSIDSILNQTYKDFEFLIMIDGGNDDEFIKKNYNDNRIKILKHQKSIGLTKSLNELIKISKGKYIMRMDSDDISLPNRFEEQIKYMEKNQDVVLCSTYAQKFGNDKGHIRNIFNDKELKCSLLFDTSLVHPSVCIRKSVLIDNNLLYDEKYIYSQDFDMWSRVSDYGNVHIIPKVLLKYRIHNKQISTDKLEQQRKYFKEILTNILKNKTNLYSKENVEYLFLLNNFNNINNLEQLINFLELLEKDKKLLQSGYSKKSLKNVLNYKISTTILKTKNIKLIIKYINRIIRITNFKYYLKKII